MNKASDLTQTNLHIPLNWECKYSTPCVEPFLFFVFVSCNMLVAEGPESSLFCSRLGRKASASQPWHEKKGGEEE